MLHVLVVIKLVQNRALGFFFAKLLGNTQEIAFLTHLELVRCFFLSLEVDQWISVFFTNSEKFGAVYCYVSR